jgi:two-component system CheB/CheR fusion protein
MKTDSVSDDLTSFPNEESASKGTRPSHYVAVGASAGGLEAIETFFANMPANTGLGFIVIQHLSPDYKSLMVELLSKKTKIPVQRIEDGMEVLRDHIYLIPPKTSLTIFHGKLLCSEQDFSKVVHLPIDIFMRSLAEDQGEKAIGIILSGTGSDGMQGTRAIKEFGGMVMVQDENTAKFNGMPRAAISTGLADFILAPEDMPAQLLSFAQHPYMTKADRSETLLSNEDKLTRIYAILRERCKLDFTYYKPSTVIRRIERRMTVNHIDEIGDYVAYLQNYSGEAVALYRELLIGVTRFFRDQEVFAKLADSILPEIFNSAPNRELRFWVAGCSTGEEAYSLAILVQEYQERMGKTGDVKIFATDIDREALQYAANGLYPESIIADVDPKLLAKYFTKKDENFQILRKIREMVVFAQHNLIKDPPFTNIALVSCRNLLIYLQPILQRKVIDFFNFSIPARGFLILGTSETTGEMDYFETVDSKLKIYRSRGHLKPASNSQPTLLAMADARSRDLKEPGIGIRRTVRNPEEGYVIERYLETVTQHFIPLAVIVNEQMEVLHIMGDTEGYFKLPTGKLVNDISKMAVKKLAVPLTTGIAKVFRQHQEVRFSNIPLAIAGAQRWVELRILPLPDKKGQSPLAVIFLNEMKKSDTPDTRQNAQSYDLSRETEERFQDLEQELQFTRENLQATIEELETSNEELQATNEELLASNEELQSTNEELQSTNEELFTVNAEYQSKIIELTELHNDIENLFATSQIGQILLDENMEVRRFSASVTRIFKMLNGDIGRPLTHISHNLIDVDLIQMIRQVQSRGLTVEREVRTQDSGWYIMKVVPYVVGPKAFSGVVISFDDITRIKEVNAALQSSHQRFKKLFDTMATGVVYQAQGGEITAANPAAERILGLGVDQMMGRRSIDPRWQAIREDGSPFPGEEHPAMIALRTGKEVRGVIMGVNNPQKSATTWIRINAVPQFLPGDERPFEVHATFEDITEQKQFLHSLQESEEHYRQLFEEMPGAFALHEIITDERGAPCNYRFLKINRMFEKLTGLRAQDILGKTVLEVLPTTESYWIERYGQVALTGEAFEFEDFSQALGKYFEVRAFRYAPGQFATIFQDVTRRKNLEQTKRDRP